MSDPTVIAIIEDDVAVREALSDLLQVLGLPCRAFDRAEAFRNVYAPGVFACLITDVRLPGISGLELLQRLKATGTTMPIILISSLTDPTVRQRAEEYGAHAFLSKPLEAEVLIGYLKSALGSDLLPSEREQRDGGGDG